MPKLTAKPSKKTTEKKTIDDFIGAGGGIPEEPPSQKENITKRLQLRLLENTVDTIDELITQRGGGQRTISRHAWIIEAIQEKLKREQAPPPE